MKVAVFGLWYVWTVSAVCLAELGHTVIGGVISEVKVIEIKNKI